MIQHKPWVRVKRMVVISDDGLIAYDELYHEGVNIIRGDNSSGKSTIANLIFYGLGGNFSNWTDAALRCKFVFLELNVNDGLITIRREVSDSPSRPMGIFFGNYEEASNSAAEGWKIFPYRLSNLKKSFSNVLFEQMDFPELKGDQDSNITMHQILRLLYIDQKSSTDSFFRVEQFDSPLTRKTIFELLTGAYDDSLYTDRLLLRDYEKEQDIRKRELDGLKRILQASDTELDKGKLNFTIAENRNELLKVENSLLSREEVKVTANVVKKDLKEKINEVQGALLEKRENLRELNEKIYSLSLDIADSDHFISLMDDRLKSLEESISIRDFFGEILLSRCPKCLNELEKDNSDANNCNLCGKPLESDDGNSAAARMKQELTLQIRESNQIIKEKEKSLKALELEKPTLEERIKQLQIDLDDNLKRIQSTRDTQIDNLLVKKGQLKASIEYYLKQSRFIEQYELLKSESSKIGGLILKLKEEIRRKEYAQSIRLDLALKEIEKHALYLLKNDLDRQTEFKYGREIEIDSVKNTYALDGKNNFSESSNVFLKNAIRYSLFFSSLTLDFFRYPKFILCDNMEDKGMEKIRTQNFQKVLVELSNKFDISHQIIFTTSMIDEDLNSSDLCVGPFYTKDRKSLLIE